MDQVLTILSGLARELILDADDLASVDALAVAAQAGGESGVTALLQLARLTSEAADDAGAVTDAVDRVQDDSALWRMAGLVVVCFAAVRADYPSRQDAQAARTAISARAEIVYTEVSAYGPETLAWLMSLTGVATRYLSRTAAERAPAVRVETGISLPATVLAYQLYGDAGRAGELVDRNRISTSLLMPVSFEAVAP
ncbi:hypothetical protein HPDFL43_05855 [Hoeflea phototrophica DFL-43]|jgi:prophage DNA circulation protein|uniref:Mu-like prophage DNA circulation protein n=1 Tax=Hoeflea phototrophica (strain DSM 17068 / NCIMB 14078 / DFL-43) TaxID=411684 RepID=A9D4T2_HOEPD|nr:hypothetical protein [Hoeflea phototrophica]EDQ33954.2 hypothetical protein HPDFL43_05855 [Hoeflea phototrophica DFL-43]